MELLRFCFLLLVRSTRVFLVLTRFFCFLPRSLLFHLMPELAQAMFDLPKSLGYRRLLWLLLLLLFVEARREA